MGQNWSISDPNGVQMGSNGFLYQVGSIRNHSQPKRTHGDPKQPIFHFFRVSILDISDGSGELFRKCSENGSGIFSGPNFCAEESSRLMGSKCQTEPRRPFDGCGSEGAFSPAAPRQLPAAPAGPNVGAPWNWEQHRENPSVQALFGE